MKVIRNRFLPIGRRYGAINLFGILFAKHDMALTPEVMNHESIHTAQIRELLWVPFYLIYIAEWLWQLCRHRFDGYRAYRSISFEREAYSRQSEPGYLLRRPPFAQWRRP